MTILGCAEPCNHDLRPLILGEPEFVVVSAAPAGKGMTSEPKLPPPLVDRFMRISPSVPLPPPLFVRQAAQTSPLGATVTSAGQVNPSPGPDIVTAEDQVAPWLVER